MKLKNAVKIFALLVSLNVTDAVKGDGSLRTRRSSEGFTQVRNNRRAKGVTGLGRQGSLQQAPLIESMDDPEALAGGKRDKGAKGDKIESEADSGKESEEESEADSEEESEEVQLGRQGDHVENVKGKTKGSGAKKDEALGRKGNQMAKGNAMTKGAKGEDLVEPDSEDSYAIQEPLNTSEPSVAESEVELELEPELESELEPEQKTQPEGFPPLEQVPETIEREIPTFSIVYTLSDSHSGEVGDGDYNELFIVTEEFLISYFSGIFSGSPAFYRSINVRLHKTNNDPFRVEWYVGPRFQIPGEVPTLPFLFERIREAFEESKVGPYLMDLSLMSDTNPFRLTTSVTLVNQTPEAFSTAGEPKTKNSTTETNKSVMVPFLAGVGFLVFVIVGFMWLRTWRTRGNAENNISSDLVSLDEEDQSLTSGGAVEKKTENSSPGYSTSCYGADDETLRYLQTIRERYSTEDESHSSKSATDLEEVSLEDGQTAFSAESETASADNSATEEADVVPGHEDDINSDLNLHRAADDHGSSEDNQPVEVNANVQDAETAGESGETALADPPEDFPPVEPEEQDASTLTADEKKSSKFNYLEFNSSFDDDDDDDLRSLA